MNSNNFQFRKLEFGHVDNRPVLEMNAPAMVQEETCLFQRDISGSREYFESLHRFISEGIGERRPAPVVRFADGEYAFYRLTKGCNGLYSQAESIAKIRQAIPFHLQALRFLAESGKMAPLLFPGNTHSPRTGLFSLFSKSRDDSSATVFIEFLHKKGIDLTGENYAPFYAVYAYLVSDEFLRLADGKRVCIVGSDFNMEACRDWFSRRESFPVLSFAQIPGSYVATRWPSVREEILSGISPEVDLFIAGAGVGALPVCVDLAKRFSVPAIDAGHVLNLMNGREDKSNGPRLFTVLRNKRS